MNQFVKEDTKTPYIESVIVRAIVKHFWGHVLKSPTKCVPLLFTVCLNTPTKVTYLQHVVIVYKKIFWFDVSVNETIFVKEVNASTSLDKEVESLIFTQLLLFPDQKKQISL